MNLSPALAEPACCPAASTPRTRRVKRELGGLWTHMSYAPGKRQRVRVLYRLEGPADAPVMAIAGGISADRHVDQWWSDHYGPGRAFDARQYRLLSIDWLGHAWPDGSIVSTHQQAAALVAVMDHFGIARLSHYMGASYGAMVGLALAESSPDRVDEVVAISGAHRSHPAATAQRLIQREIIRLALAAGDEAAGLRLARALALTSYRPASLFAERFDAPSPDGVCARLNRYFDHQARRLHGRFNAERYLSLSASLDQHVVDPRAILCPLTVIAVSSDELVTLEQLQTLAERAPQARLEIIDSAFGHDAFLKETGRLAELFAQALGQGAVA
ncbi:MAG: homoserine O-succinyltransferase MetX [Wenzhouxiangella sp.]